MRRWIALIAAVLVAVPAAPLAADVPSEVARCAAVADSLQRLVCYDAIAKEIGTPVTQAAATTTTTTTAARSEAYSGRCQATTKKGSQCKRSAKPGSRYCWQHGG